MATLERPLFSLPLSLFNVWMGTIDRPVLFYYYHPTEPWSYVWPKDIQHIQMGGKRADGEPSVMPIRLDAVRPFPEIYRHLGDKFDCFGISYNEWHEAVLIPTPDMDKHLRKFGGGRIGTRFSERTLIGILNGDSISWDELGPPPVETRRALSGTKWLLYCLERAKEDMAWMAERRPRGTLGVACDQDPEAKRWRKRRRQVDAFRRGLWRRVCSAVHHACASGLSGLGLGALPNGPR